MPFVLDTSITMAWCFAEESTTYTQQVLDELLLSYAEVPPLWMFEVSNVLASSERRGRMRPLRSEAFLDTLVTLDIRIQPAMDLGSGLSLLFLTRRYGLTAYDAAYLELAKRKGLPLATLDKDLLRAAPLEGVSLFSPQHYIR